MKHKHYDLIVAWANGAKIEARLNGGEWHELTTPAWNGIDTEYRIKREPKPDVVKYLIWGLKSWVEVDDQIGHQCIKIVIDGKGRLKSAEVT